MPTPRRLALALLCSLPAAGCCSLARFFCGPDTSPWVSVSYATPEAALATFLEAIRREDVEQVYRSLSEGYKRAHDVTSLGIHVAYARLKDEVPGVHMAGYLQVPAAPASRQDRGVTYELDLYGRTLRVDLVRQSFWEVRYRDDRGTVHSPGEVLEHDSWNAWVRIVKLPVDEDAIDDEPRSRVGVRDVVVVHPTLETLRADQIDAFTLQREWQIDGLRIDDPAPAAGTAPATAGAPRDPLGT